MRIRICEEVSTISGKKLPGYSFIAIQPGQPGDTVNWIEAEMPGQWQIDEKEDCAINIETGERLEARDVVSYALGKAEGFELI